MADLSLSPLADVLPERCTAELCQLHAELGARHSFREAGRLLETFMPCSPPNHTSVRNRLHCVSSKIETVETDTPPMPAAPARRRRCKPAEIVVVIDGAHLRAVPGLNSRHVDVTVGKGKVETTARPPRRFALAPAGTEQPAQAITAALLAQGWQPGRLVTVISDGEPALPNLVRTATGEPIRHILDWWHISQAGAPHRAGAGRHLRPVADTPHGSGLRQPRCRAASPPDLEWLCRGSLRGPLVAEPLGQ
jgi:hypothetical protein